jgi:hypothetical protein
MILLLGELSLVLEGEEEREGDISRRRRKERRHAARSLCCCMRHASEQFQRKKWIVGACFINDSNVSSSFHSYMYGVVAAIFMGIHPSPIPMWMWIWRL